MVDNLRLLAGQLLTVFAKRRHTIETPTGVIGVRGTGQELMLIEEIVACSPPFVFPGNEYNAPRREYLRRRRPKLVNSWAWCLYNCTARRVRSNQ